ncbi:hypothetical protein ES707_08692 [subsurface metagenome]
MDGIPLPHIEKGDLQGSVLPGGGPHQQIAHHQQERRPASPVSRALRREHKWKDRHAHGDEHEGEQGRLTGNHLGMGQKSKDSYDALDPCQRQPGGVGEDRCQGRNCR